MARDVLSGNQIYFDHELLNTADQDKICLTLKNYKMLKGVSTQIHGVVPVLDAPENEIMIELGDFKEDEDRINERGELG